MAEQLWLDVDRSIQMKPQREERRSSASRKCGEAGRQIELSLAPPIVSQIVDPSPSLALTSEERQQPSDEETLQIEQFGTWLLAQLSKRGSLGELAKAAKLDRHFPKTGTIEDVRTRFGILGADGDAYEALDDAERAYEQYEAVGSLR